MRKANKGEWSEFYAFLKILSERRLYAADRHLQIIPDRFYVFHKVFKDKMGGGQLTYDLESSPTGISILDSDGSVLKVFKDEGLKEKTVKIFDRLLRAKGRSFTIEEASLLMDDLLCSTLKAKSSDKEDIVAVIDDRASITETKLGFSIKSMIGGRSTLFNPGQTTNFIFEILDFRGDIEVVNEIKTSRKIQDRITRVRELGGKFAYVGTQSPIFLSNLRKIDSNFDKILAHMLLDFFSGKASCVHDLIQLLAEDRDFLEEFNFTQSDYEFKVKQFLDACALGMVANTLWDGFAKAAGGYIVVRKDGEVICYHLYHRDEFQTYLYDNTAFDSPSCSRYQYARLYQEGGKLLFKLCLQVRFKK